MQYQTMHLGSQLLRDATLRACAAAEIIGARALLVEPAGVKASEFYARYGFRPIGAGDRMFLPLSH